MNLHPYDDRTRQFRHSDVDRAEGLGIISKLLRLSTPPSAEGLLYDLSFFSGGIGIYDELAMTLPYGSAEILDVVAKLNCKTPEYAVADDLWKGDFLWLVEDDENPQPLREACARFLNENRRDFQPECRATDPIWFAMESGVNSWTALWETDQVLSYLAFDQG